MPNNKAKAPLRFEYWKSTKNSQWYWRLKAGNNEPICQSEGYKTRAAVVKLWKNHFCVLGDMVDLNAAAFAKFKEAVGLTPKKPKHYEGKLNRQFP